MPRNNTPGSRPMGKWSKQPKAKQQSCSINAILPGVKYYGWFFNGTSLSFTPMMSWEELKPWAVENIMNIIKEGNTRKEVEAELYKQSEMWEKEVTKLAKRHGHGCYTKKVKKKMEQKYGETFETLWILNIASLLVLGRIKNDNNFGYIEFGHN